MAFSIMHLNKKRQKICWQDLSVFCPFDVSKANSKISCATENEQKVEKLSVNLSRGRFFPPVFLTFFQHVCDSIAVDSVHAVEQCTLWLCISIL